MKIENKKLALVLGGGGFIGGHLAKRLKEQGYWVRVVDIKPKHEYYELDEFCHEYIEGDLRDSSLVSRIMYSPNQRAENDKENSFDEVYQLAADMGGAGYIFTGDNDANVMHNSGLINFNVAYEASKKSVKKILYTSSACIYPEHNQLDPDNPKCEESSAYPANPDSEYGWEKLLSERLYLSFHRNYGLDVKIARLHNIFGPYGTWDGGREKAPAAICRKVIQAPEGGELEIWGDGKQTRSFLYIDECLDGLRILMDSNENQPFNIGSEEMISINEFTKMIIGISGKNLSIKNIPGPEGVRGRNSDNNLVYSLLGWKPTIPLKDGITKTYRWIETQVNE
jgi:nucleoside-diphosphate-sugar epimerase